MIDRCTYFWYGVDKLKPHITRLEREVEMEKSSAFNERMSSVLSAIDTAMGQSEREGGQEHTEQ